MTEAETNELWDAIETAKRECKDSYALSYLSVFDKGCLMGPEGIADQLLYVLNNMRQWRGETARHVKAVFRKAVNELS